MTFSRKGSMKKALKQFKFKLRVAEGQGNQEHIQHMKYKIKELEKKLGST